MLMAIVVDYLYRGYILPCEGRGKATLDVEGAAMAWHHGQAPPESLAYYFVKGIIIACSLSVPY